MEADEQKAINDDNWLTKEAENFKLATTFEGEKLPSLQLEEGKIVEFTIDFSKPFDKWNDTENNLTKAIIPVKESGEDKIFWLNKKNPLYGEIIDGGNNGQTVFKVIQTGSKKSTKYNLVKD